MTPLWILIAALATVGLATTKRASADLPAYQYEVIATLGTRAPGGGTLRGGFSPGALGNGGEVAYVAGIGSRGSRGLFVDTVDAAVPIALPGEDAGDGWSFDEKPGGLGGVATPVSMTAAGDVVFAADVTRVEQNGSGVFRWERSTGRLSPVVLPGQDAPNGKLLNAIASPVLSGSGDLIFAAEFQPIGNSGAASVTGIFKLADGRVTSLVLSGIPLSSGGAILGVQRPVVNERGQVLFEASYGQGEQVSTGLFSIEDQALRLIAGEGTTTSEGTPLHASRVPRLNDRGDFAFFGDSGEWGVYRAGSAGITVIASPGLMVSGGARVRGVMTGAGSLAMNQAGDVAMVLRLEAPDAAGLFVHRGGTLVPVALPGTFLAGVGPIDDVGEDVALNDLGQIAFQVEQPDGEIDLVLATPVVASGRAQGKWATQAGDARVAHLISLGPVYPSTTVRS